MMEFGLQGRDYSGPPKTELLLAFLRMPISIVQHAKENSGRSHREWPKSVTQFHKHNSARKTKKNSELKPVRMAADVKLSVVRRPTSIAIAQL